MHLSVTIRQMLFSKACLKNYISHQCFFLPESAGVQLHNILQILHRVIHTFYCNVLAWTVEGVAAGAKVRTGQSHKGKSCAICAAADCNCLRIQPGLLDGFLGVKNEKSLSRKNPGNRAAP